MPIRIDRKVLSITISIALLTASLAAQQKNQLAQVRVEQGWLSGTLGSDPSVMVFKGVPYAGDARALRAVDRRVSTARGSERGLPVSEHMDCSEIIKRKASGGGVYSGWCIHRWIGLKKQKHCSYINALTKIL
jgi:hypothetical protein